MGEQVGTTERLIDYVRRVSLREDEILRDLRAETARLPAGRHLQVMPEEGQLLGMLVGLVSARRVLEIGTFTGYSTLSMARALPPGGRVVTCDVSAKWPAIAEPFWRRAGVADRIEVRVGDAIETLAGLRTEQGGGRFDLVFIDADKVNYPWYYEEAMLLTRPDGLIVIDNTLFLGKVADPDSNDQDTLAIRKLNSMLRDDDRVELSLIVMADGITLARKKRWGPEREYPTAGQTATERD
ncbi:O-methyltransferase [Amycolatopsis alba]|uniref:SAM-dependent methyltransferase n=2 Tax=Amycolatopsis TaxID=1813 RepID=A0A229RIV8_AMYAL|nr:class I SAM-dependent methyltransferase [Amycolatopsis alba]OXM46606.1 SAM-dependent methyltransferase [Amycolatopsis alba DSM 44262]